MQNSAHRDFMADFYRLWERFESVPSTKTSEEAIIYWTDVAEALNKLFEKYSGDLVTENIIHGFLQGLEEAYKRANKEFIVQEPVQTTMF